MTKKNNKKSISILKLSHDKSKEYFLKQENYCNFDLPIYFQFKDLLSNISTELKNKNLSDYMKQEMPIRLLEGVNYKILNNKDGKYAWRPLQLINPILYVALVHKISEEKNWEHIQSRFEENSSNKQILCLSIPRESKTNNSDKAEHVSHWWQEVEQKSIEMSLEYQCLTHTDITDCYGAIYTHSVAWALHGKNEAKEERSKSLIGNQIDNYLQDMSYGQTNGIPQGSTLMDFIAEMVLGYADKLLSCRLKEEKVSEYQILRYRDDYRIFSNSQNDNNKILKCLTEVMISLGMKLSSKKTFTPDNLIQGSIKNDKLYWIRQKQSIKSLQKHILLIHNLSMEFPNSGSLSTALADFDKRLRKETVCKESVTPIISIIADIAHKNPRVYPYSSSIISLLLTYEEDKSKKQLLEKVLKKFNGIPSTGYLEIWLQRITLKFKNSQTEIDFKEKLCNLIYDYQICTIWDSSWLESNKLKKIINETTIVDKDEINNMEDYMALNETALFNNKYYN